MTTLNAVHRKLHTDDATMMVESRVGVTSIASRVPCDCALLMAEENAERPTP